MSDNKPQKNSNQANPNENDTHPNPANPKRVSNKEQAINLEHTHGKEINHQVKDKREHHQPRDTIKD
ncbi:hypothetical protein SAMN05192588_1555 [Nonlabens sp. Hel1_33_55]|uniref:hypothetical protein n=1 Tax=Nonlabens sp. Hel1_33_55 TaxID=1336802 RepID=UPI000875E958|nr:hypothetical protein [Nonlabens sp. Hel1_33_55]SCY18368.1 hypothetical protein SAMN05192588_1555 [Nonlabens sp. Hel1_33_55]